MQPVRLNSAAPIEMIVIVIITALIILSAIMTIILAIRIRMTTKLHVIITDRTVLNVWIRVSKLWIRILTIWIRGFQQFIE